MTSELTRRFHRRAALYRARRRAWDEYVQTGKATKLAVQWFLFDRHKGYRKKPSIHWRKP